VKSVTNHQHNVIATWRPWIREGSWEADSRLLTQQFWSELVQLGSNRAMAVSIKTEPGVRAYHKLFSMSQRWSTKKLGCTNGGRFAKYETAPSSPLQSTSIGEQQGKTNFRTTSSLTGIKPSLATQLRFHYYPGLQRPSRWFKEASSSLDISTARLYAYHTSREHLIARTTLPRIQSRMISGISSGREILYRNEPRYHVYHYCRKKTKTKCKTSKDCMYPTGRVYREPYDSQEKSYDLRERD